MTRQRRTGRVPADGAENSVPSDLKEEWRRRSRDFLAKLVIVDPQTVSDLILVSGIPCMPSPEVGKTATEGQADTERND